MSGRNIIFFLLQILSLGFKFYDASAITANVISASAANNLLSVATPHVLIGEPFNTSLNL